MFAKHVRMTFLPFKGTVLSSHSLLCLISLYFFVGTPNCSFPFNKSDDLGLSSLEKDEMYQRKGFFKLGPRDPQGATGEC